MVRPSTHSVLGSRAARPSTRPQSVLPTCSFQYNDEIALEYYQILPIWAIVCQFWPMLARFRLYPHQSLHLYAFIICSVFGDSRNNFVECSKTSKFTEFRWVSQLFVKCCWSSTKSADFVIELLLQHWFWNDEKVEIPSRRAAQLSLRWFHSSRGARFFMFQLF